MKKNTPGRPGELLSKELRAICRCCCCLTVGLELSNHKVKSTEVMKFQDKLLLTAVNPHVALPAYSLFT